MRAESQGAEVGGAIEKGSGCQTKESELDPTCKRESSEALRQE